MNFLRKKPKELFMIVFLALTVLITGCQAGGTNVENVNIVAKINDEVISKDLYNKHLILFKKNYEDMYGDKVWSLDVGGKTFLQALQENVLEKLVNDQVIIQYLQKKKVEIDEEEIEKQYKDYKERMKNQTEIQKFFDENQIDESFIKEQIKTDLYMNKFYDMVTKELDVSDENLKKYYDQHLEEYRNIQVKASHILVEKEDEAKNILKELKEGKDFAELAKKYSKDPGSAAQGGDLGYFSKGMMVPQFEEAAFALKIGEISEPIKTKYGYHIIKVFDKIDEMQKFEDVKEQIKGKMMDEAIVKKSNEIKDSMKIEKYLENIQ